MPGLDRYHLHVRCFAAWEFERTKPGAPSDSVSLKLVHHHAVTVADGPRFSRPQMKTSPGGFPHENVAQWYSVVMQPETSEVGDVWRMIETALARRQEAFTLSHLMWSDDGYTVKFRQGPVNIVRTTIAAGAFGDEAGLSKLLDGVRSDFRVFDPLRGGPTSPLHQDAPWPGSSRGEWIWTTSQMIFASAYITSSRAANCPMTAPRRSQDAR